MTENQAEELQAKLDVLNSIMADEMHIIQSQVPRHSELKNLIDDNTNKGMITKYIYILIHTIGLLHVLTAIFTFLRIIQKLLHVHITVFKELITFDICVLPVCD